MEYEQQDIKYMQMALKLARRGIGSVEPNPPVGCVIAKAGQVIGKGWHKEFGGPHAEINALEDCRSLAVTPQGATMYVTLEPCCHQGKTAPCTDAILKAGLAKVLVATPDPSEHNNGRGIEQLCNAGIEVQTGLCEAEARLLNAPFIKFAATGKPWVILKWAQSIDGKLAYAEAEDQQRWLSNELSRKDAHKLRRRVQAILIGINTVVADNPELTPRPSKGKRPIRIVLDSHLKILVKTRLIRTANRSPVLIYTSEAAAQSNSRTVDRLTKKQVEVLTFGDTQGQSNLHFLLDELGNRGVQQLLVEGGPAVISSFLRERLADQIVVYIAPKILAGSGTANISEAIRELTSAIDLHHVSIEPFAEDIRLTGFLKQTPDGIN
ncbi:MAG: bifunctional diaminohydroxyphosphoribosylaminopyrimidine deaminase/5-amino-6-(5-phosphoribosylamino)uracil reductase RibD [Phycisphaerales bacterium]|nr:MAG: bifunctional diaminohydroxyphosphoribosylaminopyrimidine deaminase/5-amino-6-(5-phosphoribosylamino)uracil reductase RibD [Phycisphaerales bacterium]